MQEGLSQDDSVRPGGWRAVAVLTTLFLFGTLDRQVMALLVPAIKTDLQLTDLQISLLQGLAFGGFFLLGNLPVGWMIDKVSRRKVLFFGVIVWSIAAAASGVARTFGQLFAARAGVGAGEATIAPATYSILSGFFSPGRLALPLSIFALGGNLGSGMSFMLGGAVLAWIASNPPVILPWVGQLSGWQVAFIITGLPGILLAFLIWTIPEPRRLRHLRKGDSTYGQLFAHYRRHAVFYGTHNGGFGMIMGFIVGLQSWNATFLTREHGWGLSEIGLFLGLTQLVTAVCGMALHGWAVDRLFRAGYHDAHLRYFIVMCTLAIPFSVGAYLVESAWLMIVLYNLAYLLIMAVSSVGPAALQITTPDHLRGKASSFYMIGVTLLGTMAGPMIVASFTDLFFQDEALLGYSMAAFAALMLSLAVLLFYVGLRPMRVAVDAALAHS